MAENDLKKSWQSVVAGRFDTARELGCVDLTEGKGFLLSLGNHQNRLHFAAVEPSKPQLPVTLDTSQGFTVKANGDNVAQLGRDEIAVHKRIRNLPEPEQDDEAATKEYVDHMVPQMKPVITIWAERRGPLNAVHCGWSFRSTKAGGGGYRKLGYTMMADGRVLRMGMSAHAGEHHVDSPAKVNIMLNGRGRGLGYAVLLPANSYHGTTVFD